MKKATRWAALSTFVFGDALWADRQIVLIIVAIGDYENYRAYESQKTNDGGCAHRTIAKFGFAVDRSSSARQRLSLKRDRSRYESQCSAGQSQFSKCHSDRLSFGKAGSINAIRFAQVSGVMGERVLRSVVCGVFEPRARLALADQWQQFAHVGAVIHAGERLPQRQE